MTLRKGTKTRGSFPNEEAALKLLFLALRNVSKKWNPAPDWKATLNHFMLAYGDRIEARLERAGTSKLASGWLVVKGNATYTKFRTLPWTIENFSTLHSGTLLLCLQAVCR